MSNNIIISNGIGFSSNNATAFYTDTGAASFKNLPDINIFSGTEWSPWGDDNQEPERMKDDIENCGVLGAGIQSKVRMAVGNGIYAALVVDTDSDGNETLEWVNDAEINNWLEFNNSFLYSISNIYNILGYGWGCTQLMLNKGRNYINKIRPTDTFTVRLEKKNLSSNTIDNIYLCSDFSQVATFDEKKVRKVPVLEENYELSDLLNRTSGFEFAVLHRLLINGRQYYPRPLWKAAQAWVKISRSIPAMKEALHKNAMSIKYVVIIADHYWEKNFKGFKDKSQEDKAAIFKNKYSEIDQWLTGESNAGKSIVTGNYYDMKSKEYIDDIKITVIDEKWKDGKMLPDNAAADKQILFSMFFNPAIWGGNLLGDGASGGAGSGSDIREAYLVQLMLMQMERMLNLQIFNIVKHYNGWAKRLEVARNITKPDGTTTTITPHLVFRYKTAILTTLDTGKSTKQATT
jgi:hypothetical protein